MIFAHTLADRETALLSLVLVRSFGSLLALL